jgi:hypothetical protein
VCVCVTILDGKVNNSECTLHNNSGRTLHDENKMVKTFKYNYIRKEYSHKFSHFDLDFEAKMDKHD